MIKDILFLFNFLIGPRKFKNFMKYYRDHFVLTEKFDNLIVYLFIRTKKREVS